MEEKEQTQNNNFNKNYLNAYKYLSSKIHIKYKDKKSSTKLSNKNIYDSFESQNIQNIDPIITYLADRDEKGVLDYLINKISMNPKLLDKSLFYLNQLITMLIYKKSKYSLEQYIINKSILYLKFSVRISLFLNSFPKDQKEIQKMKFQIEQINHSSYDYIQDSHLILTKKLKDEEIMINNSNCIPQPQVYYYYKCLDFFDNLKKLCLKLFEYPLKIENENDRKMKMNRKTALRKLITLINEELDYMRGEEYRKMKKEELTNKKKNQNNEIYKNSKFNKGYILPLNNEKSNSDDNCLVIVNILPEYSTVFSTKERVPVKLTCECIELREAESENFFELYDNKKFYEKFKNLENNEEDLSIFNSNISDVLTQQLSIINPKHVQIFDKWKNLEKSLPESKEEIKKMEEKKIEEEIIKETKHDEFDDFVVIDYDTDQINPFGEPKEKAFEKIYKSSSFKKFTTYRVKCFIAKANDDLLQEMFALQLIKKFEEIFKKSQIFVKSYEVIITSETSGIIEFLNNSCSIDGILKNIPKGWDLNDFFRKYFKGDNFKRAQVNFADSLAGFCLLSYYLDIKDRHNGNIMIDNKGHIMHIDFGFLLGTSPKNMGFERAQFKLVKSYVKILDGLDSTMFKYFKAQMVKGLIESKKHFEIISSIIKIMSHSNLACLAGQNVEDIINGLHKKFLFGYSTEQIEKYVDEMIYNNYKNFWTNKYDQFQYWTNGILY